MDWRERADKSLRASTLLWAMREAMEARAIVEKARNEFQGYSFDYFHSGIISEAEKAELKFIEALDAYVDERIEAKSGNDPR